ncbi:MAG: hypothetical protein V1721_05710, partial [Pseudomonadota bacterium]
GAEVVVPVENGENRTLSKPLLASAIALLARLPARKAGTLIRNPATGEMMKGAAKPASVRVKIRPLKKLKTAALS